jgi:hypothetical protein
MMPLLSLPLCRRGFWAALAVLVGLCGLVPRPAHAQFDVLARQVTVFGVLATPKGTTIDPKLKPVEAQLKKMLPNHGFKLIRIESKRMMAGEILNCDLTTGFIASSQIVQVVDPNGKIQMRVGLSYNGFAQYEGMISTPPNQISFFDKQLPNGERLVIGIGAR